MTFQEVKSLYAKLKEVDELAWMFFYIKNIYFGLSVFVIFHLLNIGFGPFWSLSAIRYKLLAFAFGHVLCLLFSREKRLFYLSIALMSLLLLFFVE